MDVTALRRARIVLPLVELVLISILLLPWMNATASDGPQDGQTWSWNILGGSLLPGNAGLALWVAAAALLCGLTWVLLSFRILRLIEVTTA